jgi:DNA-binding MarR family transcriptional regulator
MPRSSIPFLIKRSHTLWLDLTEPALAARGLTFMQYIILVWLKDAVTATSKDICTGYCHDSGALTRVVDQLVERGLVERTRDNVDRRKVNLRLTPAGSSTIEGSIPHVVTILKTGLCNFSNREVQDFTRLLLKLNAGLQSQLDSARFPATSVVGEECASVGIL